MEHQEEWRDVKGYEWYYQVSNLGDVRRLWWVVTRQNRWGNSWTKHRTIPARILRPKVVKGWYLAVSLCVGWVWKREKVHRLVAKAFLPLVESKLIVHHLNGNKKDNRVCNLCRANHSENIIHARDTWLRQPSIIQKDMDWLVVGTYPSVNSASRATWFGAWSIWLCSRGKQKHHKWYTRHRDTPN